MVQRPHFQLKSVTHELFHAGPMYTADIIKHTTFCVVYEIRFSTLFNYASETYRLGTGSPDIFKDNTPISERVIHRTGISLSQRIFGTLLNDAVSHAGPI
jgi:hypothetical protein